MVTRFVWPTTGLEDPVQLVEALRKIGRRLAARENVARPSGLDQGRPIALATDDEAAVLLAEHTEELAEYFVVPSVPPALPGMLADKYALADVCRAQGIPYPESRRPASVEELAADAARLGYPVIVKNAQPWERLHRRVVGSSTVLANERELRALTRDWAEMPSVVVQEYVPADSEADWVVNIYWVRRCRSDLRSEWDDAVGVTGFVDSLPFVVEVELPVPVEVAVGAHRAQLEDGFGTVD